MASFASLLPRGTLLDGAMGTELIAAGLDPATEPADGWNLAHPRRVRAIHDAYLRAGAHAIQTNTFGANRVRLAAAGLADRVFEINAAGATLACDAARGTGARVIGSLGPSGATPPPEGSANLALLEQAFAEQAGALAAGGVDMLHVETMYHPKEARAAVRGCRIGAPQLPVIASVTCRREGSVYSTGLGFSPDTILQAFREEGASAVGVNCTLMPANMLDLIRAVRARTTLPLVACPTAARPGITRLSPHAFATGALALLSAGADIVGGCCGTGPDDIAATRAALDALSSSHQIAAAR